MLQNILIKRAKTWMGAGACPLHEQRHYEQYENKLKKELSL